MGWGRLGPQVTVDFPGLLVDADKGGQAEVLDLQNQDTPARVHDNEVRVLVLRADGHVIPKQVIGIELLLKAFGKAALAAGHARNATAQRWYECCHPLRASLVHHGLF